MIVLCLGVILVSAVSPVFAFVLNCKFYVECYLKQNLWGCNCCDGFVFVTHCTLFGHCTCHIMRSMTIAGMIMNTMDFCCGGIGLVGGLECS